MTSPTEVQDSPQRLRGAPRGPREGPEELRTRGPSVQSSLRPCRGSLGPLLKPVRGFRLIGNCVWCITYVVVLPFYTPMGPFSHARASLWCIIFPLVSTARIHRSGFHWCFGRCRSVGLGGRIRAAPLSARPPRGPSRRRFHNALPPLIVGVLFARPLQGRSDVFPITSPLSDLGDREPGCDQPLLIGGDRPQQCGV